MIKIVRAGRHAYDVVRDGDRVGDVRKVPGKGWQALRGDYTLGWGNTRRKAIERIVGRALRDQRQAAG